MIFKKIWPQLVVCLGLVGLLFFAGKCSLRHFLAEAACGTQRNSTLNRDRFPSALEIRKAISLVPQNAAYHAKLAYYLIRQRQKAHDRDRLSPVMERTLNRLILNQWARAVVCNPVRAWYWYKTGMYIAKVRGHGGDEHEARKKVALAMKRAAQLRPHDTKFLQRIENYLKL